jgi:hypothetical protein
MSPRIIEKTVYTFDELSAEAKERARSWWREGCIGENWWDSTYEDAETVANILGITFDQKAVPRMDGEFNTHPKIFFSGFGSQGDGACFEGTYRYAPGWKKALLAHAPKDEKLLKIGEDLQSAQASAFYQCVARTKQRGHYCHSGCMEVDVERSDDSNGVTQEQEEGITQALRDFAEWIYDSLRKEYEYHMSDECVDENIKCNEYDFDVNGRIV